MAALHVRNVPPETLAALKERAARHGRSVQQEVLAILREAAQSSGAPKPLEPIRLVTVRTRGESSWSREEIYGEGGR
jgi:plasmid stability protein